VDSLKQGPNALFRRALRLHHEERAGADGSLEGVLRPLVASERSYPIAVPHHVSARDCSGSPHTQKAPVPQRFPGEAALRALQARGLEKHPREGEGARRLDTGLPLDRVQMGWLRYGAH